MAEEVKVKNGIIRLKIVDITDLDIECFVYYATDNLKLGSGFGGAITVRGGPSIQKELDPLAPIEPGQAVISSAGELKAKHIIHVNGPKFQEEQIESKLKTAITNALRLADEKGITRLALPPMGAGFYGVPLPDSARITLGTVKEYLDSNNTKLEEVVICVNDNREYKPFRSQLDDLALG
jgi:O-acetyl-ADP-ribose deacetylase (regulator of RNase III)